MEWLIFVMAATLSVIHWFSEVYGASIEKHHVKLVSFSSGMFITYIFLHLFPEFFKGNVHLGEASFILLLAGFVAFHLAEKYVYQHVMHKKDMMKNLGELHAAGFFIDQFILGMVLYIIFSIQSVLAALLVFIPVVLHVFSSAVALNHIDEHYHKNTFLGLMLAASPLVGTLFMRFFNPDKFVQFGLLSFGVGAILYIVVRDMLPTGRRGKPMYLLLGILTSVLILKLIQFSP